MFSNFISLFLFLVLFAFLLQVLELLTIGNDSEVTRSWRMPKFTSNEMDDYSMIFGYDLPSDISLEDI